MQSLQADRQSANAVMIRVRANLCLNPAREADKKEGNWWSCIQHTNLLAAVKSCPRERIRELRQVVPAARTSLPCRSPTVMMHNRFLTAIFLALVAAPQVLADCSDNSIAGASACLDQDTNPQGCPSDVGDACDGNGGDWGTEQCICHEGNPCMCYPCCCPGGSEPCYCGEPVPKADGTACTAPDDGLNCTNAQVCSGGACVDVCDLEAMNECEVVVEDCGVDDVCEIQVLVGQSCTVEIGCGLCQDDNGRGVCVRNDSAACDDDDPCTNDSCDSAAGTCSNVPFCDDGDACNGVETCDPATLECQAGQAVECSDGNVCNGIETCDSSTGACVPGTPLDCGDGQVCTIDNCDAATGCVYVNDDGAPCDDEDLCTVGDVCMNGFCESTPRDCDDGNSCTTDTCDPATGCDHTELSDGTACNDGIPCTENDVCVNVACEGTPKACDDGVDCTDDSCDPATGNCIHTPNDANCPQLDCAFNEGCGPTGCVASPLADVLCDDQDACTIDTCLGYDPSAHPTTGCVHQVIDCDDDDLCTNDSCDPQEGCKNEDKCSNFSYDRDRPLGPAASNDRNFPAAISAPVPVQGDVAFDIEVTRFVGEVIPSTGTLRFFGEMLKRGTLGEFATLQVASFGFDSTSEVWFNGQRIDSFGRAIDQGPGLSSGCRWSLERFRIPIEKVRFPSGPGAVRGVGPTPAVNEVLVRDLSSGTDTCRRIGLLSLRIQALSPVVLVHGINSDPAFWDRRGLAAVLESEHVVYNREWPTAINSTGASFSGEDQRLWFPSAPKVDGDGLGTFKKGSRKQNAALMETGNPELSFDNKHFPAPQDLKNMPSVRQICIELGVDSVHFVAHSMGGLNTRAYLGANYKRGDAEFFKPVSLTTLATPHDGSLLADLVVQRFKLREDKVAYFLGTEGLPLALNFALAFTAEGVPSWGYDDLTAQRAAPRFNRRNIPELPSSMQFNTVVGDADWNDNGELDHGILQPGGLYSEILELFEEGKPPAVVTKGMYAYGATLAYQVLRSTQTVTTQVVPATGKHKIVAVAGGADRRNDTLVTEESGLGLGNGFATVRFVSGGREWSFPLKANHATVSSADIAQGVGYPQGDALIDWLIEAERRFGDLTP